MGKSCDMAFVQSILVPEAGRCCLLSFGVLDLKIGSGNKDNVTLPVYTRVKIQTVLLLFTPLFFYALYITVFVLSKYKVFLQGGERT